MARYALVVGMARYDNFRDLDKAATDAAEIAHILQVYGHYQVEPLPKRLVDAENRWALATDKKLIGKDLGQALATFLLKQATDQEALIYFAGHGFEVSGLGRKKKGYLATSDCTSDGRNAILFSDLNDLIRESSLSSLVLILDCCHAGSFLEQTLLESTLTAFKEKKDYYLITACRSFERAREGEEYGVFTAAVLKGLQAENADSEGVVTGDRLFDFIQRELRQSGQEPVRTGTGRSITLVSYPPKVTTVTTPSLCLEDPTGQVPLDSPFYVERSALETRYCQEIVKQSSLLRIKAPLGMGKSSLLVRILHHAKNQGYRTVLVSIGRFDESTRSNLDQFLRQFCELVSDELGNGLTATPEKIDAFWKSRFSPNINCQRFFENFLLPQLDIPLVLALDDVDEIFSNHRVAKEFLKLLREFHEKAKTRKLWAKLRLVVAYSIDAYVVMDSNSSPFNVGLEIELREFTPEEVVKLASRYELSWNRATINRLMDMVGGHPSLIRVALYHIACRHQTLHQILKDAPTEAGIYADDLRRHLQNLKENPKLAASMKAVVEANQPICLDSESAFKLYGLGLVRLQGNEAIPSFELYRQYFRAQFGLPLLPSFEYHVGGSLATDDLSYVPRKADQELYEAVKAQEFCSVLNSLQMGNRSVGLHVMQRLQAEGIACAAINLSSIGSHEVTPEQWVSSVIGDLLSGFGLVDQIDIDDWFEQWEYLSIVKLLETFIEAILLAKIPQQIVIFLIEIESILSLRDFPRDDFFAFIYSCYHSRVDKPDYRRLTFVLIGVASSSDLMQDETRTPFNIGRAINLPDFTLEEVRVPLGQGLSGKTSNPDAVLQEVLVWTGGQPFLTQKVCQLIQMADSSIPSGGEAEWVEDLVNHCILKNWEEQDSPEHLRLIRDRVLRHHRQGRMLRLYRQVLQQGEIEATESPEEIDLRLSGLIVKQQNKILPHSRIYQTIFDLNWVERELANLRSSD
jgi:hypothetical protein